MYFLGNKYHCYNERYNATGTHGLPNDLQSFKDPSCLDLYTTYIGKDSGHNPFAKCMKIVVKQISMHVPALTIKMPPTLHIQLRCVNLSQVTVSHSDAELSAVMYCQCAKLKSARCILCAVSVAVPYSGTSRPYSYR